MHTIAIDFGTSNSQIAYLDSMGRAVSLQVDGYTKIPTELYYREKQDEIFIGLSAKELYEQDKLLAEAAGGNVEQTQTLLSANRLTAFKKEFCGAEVSFDAPARTLRHRDGKPFTWGEVVTAFFRFFKKKAEEHHFLGETIESVRLTHPVHFPSCELYRRAAEAAGFTSVTMIPEPEAAYSGYMQGGKPLGDTILVFDMGGGTLDLAVLEKRGEKWLVERQPLRIDIAGLDIDIAILRKILPQIQESDTALSRVGADYTLLDAVRENIKEKWSRTERDVSFSYFFSQQNKRFHCTVPHDTMLPLVRKIMQPAYDKMLTYLVELGCVPTDVLMVGGSCLMPEIRRGVQQCMGNQVRVFAPNHGDTVVAEGAMLCESQKETENTIEPFEARQIFHGDISDISDDFRVMVCTNEKSAKCYELCYSHMANNLAQQLIGKGIDIKGEIQYAKLSHDGSKLCTYEKVAEEYLVMMYDVLQGGGQLIEKHDDLKLSNFHAAFHSSKGLDMAVYTSDINTLRLVDFHNRHKAALELFPDDEKQKIYNQVWGESRIQKNSGLSTAIALARLPLYGYFAKLYMERKFRERFKEQTKKFRELLAYYGNRGLAISRNRKFIASSHQDPYSTYTYIFKKKDNSDSLDYELFHSIHIKPEMFHFSGDEQHLVILKDETLFFISLQTGAVEEKWEIPREYTSPYKVSLRGRIDFDSPRIGSEPLMKRFLRSDFAYSPLSGYIAIYNPPIPEVFNNDSSVRSGIYIFEKSSHRCIATISVLSSSSPSVDFLRFSADGSMLATNKGIWDVSPLLA